jgi:hypothetical protein
MNISGYERPWQPVRDSIPIYLGAMGPAMTKLAGEVGDGWISHEAVPLPETGAHPVARSRAIRVVAPLPMSTSSFRPRDQPGCIRCQALGSRDRRVLRIRETHQTFCLHGQERIRPSSSSSGQALALTTWPMPCPMRWSTP